MMGLRPVDVDGPEFEASGVHLLDDVHVLHAVLLLLGQRITPALIIRHKISQTFFSLTHKLIAECRSSDTEIGRVIGQWIVDLTVSDSPGHHNIRRRMGLGEHVLDHFTGLDVPVLHPFCLHGLNPFGLQSLSLSYTLHNRKGQTGLHALMNQVQHNIVPGTDSRGNGGLAFLNKALGVVQPHIGTMGQSRDPDQVREGLRLGVAHHLDYEVGAELGNAKASQGAAVDILRLDSQSLCILKQRHDVLVIQWNGLRIQAGQVLQHTNHGRIIVSQNVQLQQVVVDGVVIKMGGNDVRGHIVGGMLNGSKGVNLLPVGQYHDTARMLARRAAHTHAALDDPIDLAVSLVLSPLLVIIFHITKSRLVRQCSDGPRPEGLACTENDLRILMGL